MNTINSSHVSICFIGRLKSPCQRWRLHNVSHESFTEHSYGVVDTADSLKMTAQEANQSVRTELSVFPIVSNGDSKTTCSYILATDR